MVLFTRSPEVYPTQRLHLADLTGGQRNVRGHPEEVVPLDLGHDLPWGWGWSTEVVVT